MTKFICPSCGKIVDLDYKVCPYCKYHLEEFLSDSGKIYDYAKHCLEQINNPAANHSAYILLRRASRLNNKDALYELGLFYYNKRIIVNGHSNSNQSFAETCFIQSAKLGNVKALNWLKTNKIRLVEKTSIDFINKIIENEKTKELEKYIIERISTLIDKKNLLTHDKFIDEYYKITYYLNMHIESRKSNAIYSAYNELSLIVNQMLDERKKQIAKKIKLEAREAEIKREIEKKKRIEQKKLFEEEENKKREIFKNQAKELYLNKIIFHRTYGKGKVTNILFKEKTYDVYATCKFSNNNIQMLFPHAFEKGFISFDEFPNESIIINNDINNSIENQNIEDITDLSLDENDEVILEERQNLNNFYKTANETICYYNSKKPNYINEKNFDDKDAWEEFIYLKSKADRYDNMIEEIYRNLNTPYIGRMQLKDKDKSFDFYIGKEKISDMNGNILVHSWYSELGNKIYDDENIIYKINDNEMKLLKKRKIDIKNKKILNVFEVFNSIKNINQQHIISDNYLLKILENRKKEGKVGDIVVSIQSHQNKIITNGTLDNIIVQGCAGSGKTMIMFHRIKYILGNNLYGNENILAITPSKRFNDFLKPLLIDLNITDASVYSITDYYIAIIDSYTEKKFSELIVGGNIKINSQNVFLETTEIKDDKYLDDEIVEYYYSEEFREKIKMYINSSENRNLDFELINQIKNNKTWLKINLIDGILSKNPIINLLPQYTRKINVIHKCEIYALCLIMFLMLKGKKYIKSNKDKVGSKINIQLGKHKKLFIDEYQDLSFSELLLIKEINEVNDNKITMDLYGDVNQNINKWGIFDYKILNKLLNFKIFNINHNYRNTSEIINYVNNKCSIDMKNIGVSGQKIEHIKREDLINIFVLDDSKRKAIICSDKSYNLIRKDYYDLSSSIFTVKDIKGLEFDSVYVLLDGMIENETYIALTRGLSKLTIIE